MSLYRVKARWSGFTGAPGYSIFHFDGPDGAVGAPPEDCAAAVATFFGNLQDRFTRNVRIQVESTVEVINTATGELEGFEDVPTPPVMTGLEAGGYSGVSGANVTWMTGTVRRSRRVRGRTFLVPLASACYQDDGTLMQATIDDINAAALALRSQTGSLMVYGRPSGTGASDGVAAAVTGHRVADKAAVLRSRRD
jgi:hypothetical protein